VSAVAETDTPAVLFQSMPPLSGDEYAALEQSIKDHGIQVPILVDTEGVVIDGHHRKKIADDLGVHCPRKVLYDATDTEKRTLALSLNLDRRHLSREQRRDLIAASLKADPQLSNREHARRTGASDHTVADIRDDLEEGAQITHLDKRDNPQGRPQPATKTPKTIPPAPAPKPSGSSRRPLTDQFFDAAFDLTKAVERVQRLANDDRFTQNAEKVAARHRSDILRAIDGLTSVADRLLPA
jgi:hypothetical protein